MKKSLFLTIILIIILSYLIVHITRSLGWWWKVDNSKKELINQSEGLGQERIRLQNQVEFGLTDQFVEREARDKLNFGKEGETVLLLPTKTP